jgi:hypothetical protein
MQRHEMGGECSIHDEKLIQNSCCKSGRRMTSEDLYATGKM